MAYKPWRSAARRGHSNTRVGSIVVTSDSHLPTVSVTLTNPSREGGVVRMRYDGRIALITGGSRGIGRQLASDLAAAGATVVVAARSQPDITATVASIREAGGKAWGLRCDVADLDQVHGTVAAVERDHGRLDLLATCAAIAPVAPVAELDPHALQRVVGVNLLGTMWCAQAVLPLMRRQHAGTIVTFSSHSARLPLPRAAAYCATKAGVAAFTEALYTEVHRDGIDVLTVYPAVVPDTDLARADIAQRGAPPKWATRTAAEVSRAVLRALASGRTQVVLPRGSTAVHVIRALAPTLTLRRLAKTTQ